MPTTWEMSGDSVLCSAAHYPDARSVHMCVCAHACTHTHTCTCIYTHTHRHTHCPALDYLHSKAMGEASLTYSAIFKARVAWLARIGAKPLAAKQGSHIVSFTAA